MQRTVTKTILVTWAVLLSLALPGPAGAEGASSRGIDLGDYKGQVVVLDFWASWCVPCRRSFPWLNSMSERYAADGLVVLGVNVDKKRENADEFLRDYPASFQIRYDPAAVLAKEFGVQGMPTSYIIGRDGQIKSHHIGFKVKRQDEYEAKIVAALQETTE